MQATFKTKSFQLLTALTTLLALCACGGSGGSSSDGAPKTLEWSFPTGLDDNISPDGQDALLPQVAMDESGNAIVVWAQNDGSANRIFLSERDGATADWALPSGLDDHISPDGLDSWEPAVAMDEDGNAIVVWSQNDFANDGDGLILLSEREGATGAWTHPSGLDDSISPEGQVAMSPTVAMDSSGNAVVAWVQTDDRIYKVFMNERNGATGAWTHPSGLNDHISSGNVGPGSPQLAMDERGNAVLVWVQTEFGSTGTGDLEFTGQIFLSERDGATGEWTAPSMLGENFRFGGGGGFGGILDIAMDNSGNALIASNALSISFSIAPDAIRSEYRTEQFSLFERNGTTGAWTSPFDLGETIISDFQEAMFPQVAIDDSGNALLLWQQSDGSADRIFLSERDGATGTWTHPAGLSDSISPAGQDALYPRVAMNAGGDAAVVWIQNDGASDQIFLSRRDGANRAWAHPASLDDTISPDGEDVVLPQVAMDESGHALVVWSQSDGTSKQIFLGELR